MTRVSHRHRPRACVVLERRSWAAAGQWIQGSRNGSMCTTVAHLPPVGPGGGGGDGLRRGGACPRDRITLQGTGFAAPQEMAADLLRPGTNQIQRAARERRSPMSAPLRSRNPPLIMLGAILTLLACTKARGQAALERSLAIPSMPYSDARANRGRSVLASAALPVRVL